MEINFELIPEVKTIFEKDLDPKTIVWKLGLLVNKPIIPGKTLIFLDEIQASPQAILAICYFYELMPELHVIAAGSFVDFALEKVGCQLTGSACCTPIHSLFLNFLPQLAKCNLSLRS